MQLSDSFSITVDTSVQCYQHRGFRRGIYSLAPKVIIRTISLMEQVANGVLKDIQSRQRFEYDSLSLGLFSN